MITECLPPSWTRLIFAPAGEHAAATPEERAAYANFVKRLVARPEDFGFRHETPEDVATDDRFDTALASENRDWG
ncbi:MULTISPECIES: hypothetical protein [unclassified Bradyrhizobium]|uniref:hypothetical protein n=1 Tax=Bradyrhizobium sp. USDA 4541 TaxID=2817704 RepID=UPI0020A3A9BD|nr:hypothetical protein [Bradyrhizobium sp. USDA 4541]MCP1852864.1 hypothetical protein [Bradyrhizobium sp. USDA 4541]